MLNILFVCLGNICRSPMAEAMFRDLVKREGLQDKIRVDSAGTGNWHAGKPPHEGTINILLKNSINTEGLIARQINKKDFDEYDYIIAMDTENKKNIEKLEGANKKATIRRLLDEVDHIDKKDVPDPYFTGNFDEVYTLVKEGCERLLMDIKSKHKLVVEREDHNGEYE